MIGSLHHQSSLFYVAFAHEAALIRDDELDQLDALLQDDELLELVRDALKRRSMKSATTGRRSIAPDRLLRCAVLKARKDWSLRELERELRASLLYRHFTRFDSDRIPSIATFSRNFALLDDALLHRINDRVVHKAVELRVARGNKLRTDTTVVESNIHHPTDSTLLNDGVRVLTRALDRVASACAPGVVKVVDRSRAAKREVIAIHTAAKSFTDGSKAKLQAGYKKLVSITGGILRKAVKVADSVANKTLAVAENAVVEATVAVAQIQHFAPLVKKVIAQTKARVFKGNTHFPGKVISLFEEHSQAIRKGKSHKPAEFGRLVRIDEVESGIVSNYEVLDGNPADVNSWKPALEQHKAVFGHAPRLATADRGFQSAANVRIAEDIGVKKVALPARGRLSQAQAKIQKQRWFRKAQGWRAGIEGRIGTLEHRFGMDRARFKHDGGFKRSVGWSVITNNVVCVARALVRQSAAPKAKASNA